MKTIEFFVSRRVWLAVGLIGVLSTAPSGLASDQEKSEAIMTLSFKPLFGESGQLPETLVVVLDAAGQEISAFDLKFGCNADDRTIAAVLPGELEDSCGWKFFEARPLRSEANHPVGDQLWQVIGLAELIPDSTGPACYSIDRPITLASIILSKNSGRAAVSSPLEFYFYWEDCGDNTVADRSGNTLYLSRQVTDPTGEQSDQDDFMAGTFPTRKGAPESCSRRKAVNRPKRGLDFENWRMVTVADSSRVAEDGSGGR